MDIVCFSLKLNIADIFYNIGFLPEKTLFSYIYINLSGREGE